MPSKFGHSLSSDIVGKPSVLSSRGDRQTSENASLESVFSERSRTSFEPNRLNLALLEAKARGASYVDLTVSNPTAAGISYDDERIRRALSPSGPLRYEPEPFGLGSARGAIAGLWAERGMAVSSENVIVTASTSEAYAFAFKLLCDPGDQVLVPAPSYPLIEHLAALDSVELVRYPLVYEGGFSIDIASLRRAVTPRTRAIALVSPNNPTGSYIKRGELGALGELGLPLVSDEVFAEYPLVDDANRARSVLEESRVLVIALDGLSKLAALPQVKLAWMTLGGPAEVLAEARTRLELVADTFLSPSTLAQAALPELLASRHVAAGAIRARIRKNYDHLVSRCAGSAVTPLRVEGGWYAVLRLPDIATDEDWALAFLGAGASVHPGYFYDFAGPPHAVVSLIAPEDVFEKGVRQIVDCVARRIPRDDITRPAG
jgi:aspartate/methionine/tyrosine aminotransferase